MLSFPEAIFGAAIFQMLRLSSFFEIESVNAHRGGSVSATSQWREEREEGEE